LAGSIYLIYKIMKNNFIKSIAALALVVVVGTTTFTSVYGYGSSHHGGTQTQLFNTAPVAKVLGAATSTVTTAPACSGMYLTDYMRKGKANNPEQVKKLQAFLAEQGIATPVTGFFGDLTEASVKTFQAKYAAEVLTPWKLTEPTGYVFKTTRAKINNMVCPGSEVMPASL
jgi:peptidoglycan hydrolase-like protein with peptidoglycan-binding domain